MPTYPRSKVDFHDWYVSATRKEAMGIVATELTPCPFAQHRHLTRCPVHGQRTS